MDSQLEYGPFFQLVSAFYSATIFLFLFHFSFLLSIFSCHFAFFSESYQIGDWTRTITASAQMHLIEVARIFTSLKYWIMQNETNRKKSKRIRFHYESILIIRSFLNGSFYQLNDARVASGVQHCRHCVDLCVYLCFFFSIFHLISLANIIIIS